MDFLGQQMSELSFFLMVSWSLSPSEGLGLLMGIKDPIDQPTKEAESFGKSYTESMEGLKGKLDVTLKTANKTDVAQIKELAEQEPIGPKR